MDEKERELRQKLAAKLDEARNLTNGGKLEEARAAADAAKELRKQIDLHEELRATDTGGKTTPIDEPKADDERSFDIKKEYRSAFQKYIKYGKDAELTDDEQRALKEMKTQARSMSEGEKASGGILVPEDISFDIIKQKKTKRSVRNLVGVKTVGTLSGSRPKRRGTDMRMKKVGEKTKIDEMDTPQYSEINYKVRKYAGIFEVTNELMADSAVSIDEELRDWYSEISLNTENAEVFYGPGGEDDCEGIFTSTQYRTLKCPAEVDVKTLRKLKNMVDASYRAGAKFVMNTSATETLADIKYSDGKSVLVPDPTKADVFTLFGFQVEIFDDIKNENGKTKIAFGNFEVGYYFFDRKSLEAKTTDVGGDAFENDTTLTRVIQRFDGKPANEDAIVILTDVPVSE
ncbi:phage major capsid protein [Paenibacillus melissococcoides]|uniref:Phage major capsid protein n=3 Tax=Paenibacillus melissococcoides TaxID=2912268 RepID=A0ABM9GAI5_9BACL|nr:MULTISPECIES: phage major capsid protein [Paenibacillus]MEB9894868.1 phage major capsid protein [Bacillus cereus]QVQ56169.1 major capsid protein [Paenibacillus phage Pd_22F]CAH8247369.1 phage major capsid protein [Paenibacillus melissococcoides]CAH8248435.1 phage major capsid protein [Paenibacillus melissococcoides]CAH8249467.1 phage major capsid protein [Paenibacillus melissococcoides]